MDGVHTDVLFPIQKKKISMCFFRSFFLIFAQSDFSLTPLLTVHIPIATNARTRVRRVRGHVLALQDLKIDPGEIIWSKKKH